MSISEWFYTLIMWAMRGGLIYIWYMGYRHYSSGVGSLKWNVVDGTITKSQLHLAVNPSAPNSSIPYIEYTYNVAGVDYMSDQITFSLHQGAGNSEYSSRFIKKYIKGNKVSVFYNPNKTSDCVLEPGIDKKHFYMTMALGTCVFGGIGFCTYIF